MNRSHQYLATLLDRVPRWELSTNEYQDSFEKIKTRISNTANLRDELASLYKVQRFADVALGLLWIAERVDRDPSKTESTLEEEGFVLSLLKNSFEGTGGPETTGVMPSSEQPFGFDFPQQDTVGESPSSAPSEVAASGWTSETSTGGMAESSLSSVASGGEADEKTFSLLFEKLLEAVQSGSVERSLLSEQLIKKAEEVQAATGVDEEYSVFCGLLVEFLNYVSVNILYDDIRAMNLLSNVFDPFSQWAKIDVGARLGLLEQPIEMLRDFRTLFE
jgi:hypothetical protein